MTREGAKKIILDVGIVPVIRASSQAHAMAAATAVAAGGIPIVEITMTVPGAVAAIAQLCKSLGNDVLVGAGTVIDAETAKRCVDAGAQFFVSPGFDYETVRFAYESRILMMAGALTPTEVIAAWKSGADFVKVFPCSAVGGPSYIKALKGPFPHVALVPTGGVNLNNVGEFIRAGSSAVGVGSELVSSAALESGDTSSITDLAKRYVSAVQNARPPQKIPAATS
jgi:2-dehydro-3-deoxyphosphogluconate aldolase/(4S)-4-hydroxy-2-oxoglutarate aldolase